MNWMKQLDAIRALGVAGVFYKHFVDHRLQPFSLFGHQIVWGSTSVDAFYVLSGFLITGILLKSKMRIDSGKETLFSSVKQFMFRRTLRIFPIFYLTLALAYVFSIPHVRESIWWHVTYTSNYYIAQCGSWNHSTINHLWSLAVEEQFYLLWPWLILMVPKRMLPAVLLSVICIAPAFRYFCMVMGTNKLFPFVATFGNFDLLGMGALLAYFKTYYSGLNEATMLRFTRGVKTCLYCGGLMYILSIILLTLGMFYSLVIFTRTFEGLMICWLINKAADGFGGIIGYILESKPLLFLGKISYGLYLFHNFVPSITPSLFRLINIPVPTSIAGECATYTVISIVLATISWHVIEKPILSIKNKASIPPAAVLDLWAVFSAYRHRVISGAVSLVLGRHETRGN